MRARSGNLTEGLPARDLDAADQLLAAVSWYFRTVYREAEGPGVLPFYCDRRKVGHFAVEAEALGAGHEDALFRLFVALAMFQARRDVVIMDQQRRLSAHAAVTLTSVAYIAREVGGNRCAHLASAAAFDEQCSVQKRGPSIDCDDHPGLKCHVKDATAAFNRMGDMGKLPTSAWLRAWACGRWAGLHAEVLAADADPAARAELMVTALSQVHRVGRKLATMFVSALSVPALAPGLTPWFPEIDGNQLIVVDTHVARAVDALRGGAAPRTYTSREAWLRKRALAFDLRTHAEDVPRYSPRLVQQALYWFCSRSNRTARSDVCAAPRTQRCTRCAPLLCPFIASDSPASLHLACES